METSKPVARTWPAFLRHVSTYLASGSLALFLMGFMFIGFFVASNGGRYFGNLGIGWLAACAAFVLGCLAGLIVGIPRFISSGALRHAVEAGRVTATPPAPAPPPSLATPPAAATPPAPAGTPAAAPSPAATPAPAAPAAAAAGLASQGQGAQDQGGGAQPSRLSPSSNLAEISDWLTKLLLGAGLVELTRLGHPLGALIDAVARGLGSPTPSGQVVAAAILLTYVALGFLDGYVVTTLWYGKHLQDLGYQ